MAMAIHGHGHGQSHSHGHALQKMLTLRAFRLGLPRAMDQWQAGSECHILEPFWVHFGTPEPFWVHFGAHLGLQEHIWAADPILGPILEPFWDHFGVHFGPKKQPKNKSKLKTLSDTILGPMLEPFWDQNWTDFDVIWELC